MSVNTNRITHIEIKARKQDDTRHCLTETLVGVLKNDYASDARVSEISKKLMEQNQQVYKMLAQEALFDK